MERVRRFLGVDGRRLGSGGVLLRRALVRYEQALAPAMKSATPVRCNFSMFVTTTFRDYLLSR